MSKDLKSLKNRFILIIVLAAIGALVNFFQPYKPALKDQKIVKENSNVDNEQEKDDVLKCSADKSEADDLLAIFGQSQNNESCLYVGCNGFF